MWTLCISTSLGEAGDSAANSSDIQVGDDAFAIDSEEGEANFMSILLTNLQVNYEAWKAELPEEEETKEEAKKEADTEKKDEQEEKEGVKELGKEEAVKEMGSEDQDGGDKEKVCFE